MRQAEASKLIVLHTRAVKAAVRHEIIVQARAKRRAWDAFQRAEVSFLALIGKLTKDKGPAHG